MPIDVFKLWTSFNGLVNSFQGGFYPPDTVFMPAVNAISNEMWEQKTKIAQNNQKVQEDLLPFLRTYNCIVTSSNNIFGSFLQPPDYGYYLDAGFLMYNGNVVACEDCNTCAENEDDVEKYERVQRYLDGVERVNVSKIDTTKWNACISSYTKKPTMQKPKITQSVFKDQKGVIKNGFLVSPRQVSVIVLDYYVRPTDAVFAYTVSTPNVQTGSGEQIIYDQKNSKPLEWDETLINEFLWRLAERFGVTTKNQFLTQYAGMKAEKIS